MTDAYFALLKWEKADQIVNGSGQLMATAALGKRKADTTIATTLPTFLNANISFAKAWDAVPSESLSRSEPQMILK